MELTHLIELISELQPGQRLKYVRGEDECVFESIEPSEPRIFTKTPNGKPFAFAGSYLSVLAERIKAYVPFNISQMMNNSGSFRPVIETVIAHTKEFYWLQKESARYVVWVPSHPHDVAILTQWTDLEYLRKMEKLDSKAQSDCADKKRIGELQSRWHLLFAECQRVNEEWKEDWYDRYKELIEDVRAVEEFDEAMFRRLIIKKRNGICSYGRGAMREEFFVQLIQDADFLAALKNFRANRSVETFNELAAVWQDFSDRVNDKQHPILLNRLAAALGTDVSCVASNSDFMSIWDKLVAAKLIDLKRSSNKNWFADNLELVRFIDAQIKDCDGYDEYNRNIFIWMLRDLPIPETDEKEAYTKNEIKMPDQKPIDDLEDFIDVFRNDVEAAGLIYESNLIKRFVCALLAKPFVVLTGLSGSGKTKLAQTFAEWIAVEGTSCIVPVGADWANSEKMLGYPNGLDPKDYILPDSGVLKLMIDANDNKDVPFFLILDEMNLSHVERYFADFLSAMESKGKIKLYDGDQRYASNGMPVPKEIPFPQNLFVIGTMNVDETTHAFSPKVLDRAQVIEFRVTPDEMRRYLDAPTVPDVKKLSGKGAAFAAAFKRLHDAPPPLTAADKKAIADTLNKFFPDLTELGSEFAYRTAGEALAFCAFARSAGMSADESIDSAIMQKLLPKLHGSRRRLARPLEAFWKFCRKDGDATELADLFKKDSTVEVKDVAKHPVSAEKIRRLCKAVEDNGFASYAEA